MKREIKFRGWDIANKQMFPMTPEKWNWYWSNSSKEEVTIMQYTGLKDKNGVEIYEGDILKSLDYEGRPYIVHWGNAHTGHATSFMVGFDMNGDHPEVIGNIYEHPHLLANKEQQV